MSEEKIKQLRDDVFYDSNPDMALERIEEYIEGELNKLKKVLERRLRDIKISNSMDDYDRGYAQGRFDNTVEILFELKRGNK